MVEQGDIICCAGIEFPCVVVSRNLYNKSGSVIVCPITKNEAATLSYEISSSMVCGYVQCDNLRLLNVFKRNVQIRGHIDMKDLVNVLSRINSLFDLI